MVGVVYVRLLPPALASPVYTSTLACHPARPCCSLWASGRIRVLCTQTRGQTWLPARCAGAGRDPHLDLGCVLCRRARRGQPRAARVGGARGAAAAAARREAGLKGRRWRKALGEALGLSSGVLGGWGGGGEAGTFCSCHGSRSTKPRINLNGTRHLDLMLVARAVGSLAPCLAGLLAALIRRGLRLRA